MKKLALFIILTVTSCVSTKVSRVNQYDYSVLKPDSEYIIKTKTGEVFRQFKFREETESSIVGIYKNEELKVDKEDIAVINKFNVAKTASLVVAGVLTGVAITISIIALQNIMNIGPILMF
ncbi:MAG: hypothetical protein LBE36_09295 [Flavobacteriaceae bacterium]|jgi:hypothetical protein|nr:hypothetical protein [Flavobacteriaceae bacterium]